LTHYYYYYYDSQRRSATWFSQQHWPTVSSTRAELRESVKAQLTVVHLLNKMIDDSTPGCLAFAWIRHCPDPLTRTPDMTSSTTSPCSSFSVRCAALSRSPYFHRLSAERRRVIIIPRHSTVIRAVVFHDLESVTRRRGKLPSLSPSSGCCTAAYRCPPPSLGRSNRRRLVDSCQRAKSFPPLHPYDDVRWTLT